MKRAHTTIWSKLTCPRTFATATYRVWDCPLAGYAAAATECIKTRLTSASADSVFSIGKYEENYILVLDCKWTTTRGDFVVIADGNYCAHVDHSENRDPFAEGSFDFRTWVKCRRTDFCYVLINNDNKLEAGCHPLTLAEYCHMSSGDMICCKGSFCTIDILPPDVNLCPRQGAPGRKPTLAMNVAEEIGHSVEEGNYCIVTLDENNKVQKAGPATELLVSGSNNAFNPGDAFHVACKESLKNLADKQVPVKVDDSVSSNVAESMVACCVGKQCAAVWNWMHQKSGTRTLAACRLFDEVPPAEIGEKKRYLLEICGKTEMESGAHPCFTGRRISNGDFHGGCSKRIEWNFREPDPGPTTAASMCAAYVERYDAAVKLHLVPLPDPVKDPVKVWECPLACCDTDGCIVKDVKRAFSCHYSSKTDPKTLPEGFELCLKENKMREMKAGTNVICSANWEWQPYEATRSPELTSCTDEAAIPPAATVAGITTNEGRFELSGDKRTAQFYCQLTHGKKDENAKCVELTYGNPYSELGCEDFAISNDVNTCPAKKVYTPCPEGVCDWHYKGKTHVEGSCVAIEQCPPRTTRFPPKHKDNNCCDGWRCNACEKFPDSIERPVKCKKCVGWNGAKTDVNCNAGEICALVCCPPSIPETTRAQMVYDNDTVSADCVDPKTHRTSNWGDGVDVKTCTPRNADFCIDCAKTHEREKVGRFKCLQYSSYSGTPVDVGCGSGEDHFCTVVVGYDTPTDGYASKILPAVFGDYINVRPDCFTTVTGASELPQYMDKNGVYVGLFCCVDPDKNKYCVTEAERINPDIFKPECFTGDDPDTITPQKCPNENDKCFWKYTENDDGELTFEAGCVTPSQTVCKTMQKWLIIGQQSGSTTMERCCAGYRCNSKDELESGPPPNCAGHDADIAALIREQLELTKNPKGRTITRKVKMCGDTCIKTLTNRCVRDEPVEYDCQPFVVVRLKDKFDNDTFVDGLMDEACGSKGQPVHRAWEASGGLVEGVSMLCCDTAPGDKTRCDETALDFVCGSSGGQVIACENACLHKISYQREELRCMTDAEMSQWAECDCGAAGQHEVMRENANGVTQYCCNTPMCNGVPPSVNNQSLLCQAADTTECFSYCYMLVSPDGDIERHCADDTAPIRPVGPAAQTDDNCFNDWAVYADEKKDNINMAMGVRCCSDRHCLDTMTPEFWCYQNGDITVEKDLNAMPAPDCTTTPCKCAAFVQDSTSLTFPKVRCTWDLTRSTLSTGVKISVSLGCQVGHVDECDKHQGWLKRGNTRRRCCKGFLCNNDNSMYPVCTARVGTTEHMDACLDHTVCIAVEAGEVPVGTMTAGCMEYVLPQLDTHLAPDAVCPVDPKTGRRGGTHDVYLDAPLYRKQSEYERGPLKLTAHCCELFIEKGAGGFDEVQLQKCSRNLNKPAMRCWHYERVDPLSPLVGDIIDCDPGSTGCYQTHIKVAGMFYRQAGCLDDQGEIKDVKDKSSLKEARPCHSPMCNSPAYHTIIKCLTFKNDDDHNAEYVSCVNLDKQMCVSVHDNLRGRRSGCMGDPHLYMPDAFKCQLMGADAYSEFGQPLDYLQQFVGDGAYYKCCGGSNLEDDRNNRECRISEPVF